MNLHHDKEAFAELIIGAANELAIPTNVIEKDYYVTITLKALAEKTKDMVLFVPVGYETVIQSLQKVLDSGMWE